MKNTNDFENRAMRRERDEGKKRRRATKGAKGSEGVRFKDAEGVEDVEKVKVIIPNRVFRVIEGGQEFALILSGEAETQAMAFVRTSWAEFEEKTRAMREQIEVQKDIEDVSEYVWGNLLGKLGESALVRNALFVGGMLLGGATLSKCDTQPNKPVISGPTVAGEENLKTQKKALTEEDLNHLSTPQKANWADMGLGTSKPNISTIEGKEVVIFKSKPSDTEDSQIYYVDCDGMMGCLIEGEPQLLSGVDTLPGHTYSSGEVRDGKFYFSKSEAPEGVGDIGYNTEGTLEVSYLEGGPLYVSLANISIVTEDGTPYLLWDGGSNLIKTNMDTWEHTVLDLSPADLCDMPDKDEETGLWMASKKVEMAGEEVCKIFSGKTLEEVLSGAATYLGGLNQNSNDVKHPRLYNQIGGAKIVLFTETDDTGKPAVYWAEVQPYCGNGTCDKPGEDSTTCPGDCPVVGPDTVVEPDVVESKQDTSTPDTSEPTLEIVNEVSLDTADTADASAVEDMSDTADTTPDVEVIEVIDEAGDTAFELEVPIGDTIDESAIPDTEDVQGGEATDPETTPDTIDSIDPDGMTGETTTDTTAEQVQNVLAGVFELDPDSNCNITINVIEEGVHEVVIDGDTYDVCTVEFYVPGIEEPGTIEFFRIKDDDGNIIKDGPVKATCRIYPGKGAPVCDTNRWSTYSLEEDGHKGVYKHGGIEMVASASVHKITPVEINGEDYLIIDSLESQVVVSMDNNELASVPPGVAMLVRVADGEMQPLPEDWQDMPIVPDPELTTPEMPENDVVEGDSFEEDDSLMEDDTSGDTIEKPKPPKDEGCSAAPFDSPAKSPFPGTVIMMGMVALAAMRRRLFGKKKEA